MSRAALRTSEVCLKAILLFVGLYVLAYLNDQYLTLKLNNFEKHAIQMYEAEQENKNKIITPPPPVVDSHTEGLLTDTLDRVEELERRIDNWNMEHLGEKQSTGSPQCAVNPYDLNVNPESASVKYACCYRDVNDPENNIGRPFKMDHKMGSVLQKYLTSPVITEEDKVNMLAPQPVTAFSDNHFDEHLMQIGSAMRIFTDSENLPEGEKPKTIIIYDLGMSEEQIGYVKRNSSFQYRKLSWDEYPAHVETLCTYSWKTVIWAEILAEFGSITWFDTSVHWWPKSREGLINTVRKYAIDRGSSFLYYGHMAGHSISWATNAGMFDYLPATIRKMDETEGTLMPQANGVMIWNTIAVRNGIMKWGLLCALTKYCMAPKTVWRSEIRPIVNKWCPKGGETKTYSYICHRFDQSLFAVLVRNHYRYNTDRYQIGEHELLANPERTG